MVAFVAGLLERRPAFVGVMRNVVVTLHCRDRLLDTLSPSRCTFIFLAGEHTIHDMARECCVYLYLLYLCVLCLGQAGMALSATGVKGRCGGNIDESHWGKKQYNLLLNFSRREIPF